MTRFILNDTLVESDAPEGTVLLDIIRYHQQLKGTKIGCREGDCGACTVLVGELKGDKVEYRSMTSCLLALANVQGKHIVTVEGLNMDRLSPVQQAMVDESGTQCGFCTPGFVVSLSGCCTSHDRITPEIAVRAIDGNICRCTGYKSIERAATIVASKLANKDAEDPVDWSVKNGFLPEYFSGIRERLKALSTQAATTSPNAITVAGGTDLYVQKHDTMHHSPVRSVFNDESLKGIRIEGDQCIIGGSTTAADLMHSEDLRRLFPELGKHLLLVSSTPIRNMGTLAGNFVNASPIGDLTAIFLALNSTITLSAIPGHARNDRTLMLKDLYQGYKQLDKSPDELVTAVRFTVPDTNTRFHFEKVSKRTHLDIASVNTAIRLELEGDTIREAHVSAGGVAPTPKYLTNTSAFLVGKAVSNGTVRAAFQVMNDEIAPISDVRGTAEYKRLLLRQLFFAHFMELFPERFTLKELVA
ncbi:MAG: 2Fe-2S iron-sulfur cluster binding domain-containing protein [Flavobacteriales bacterium]|jgi:xanthine dehydrogenase small subunit|nr:MAG: 2Fe-2S iron-sulfur cluster binding domain-containing protein [Flavobacteriales bacterium]